MSSFVRLWWTQSEYECDSRETPTKYSFYVARIMCVATDLTSETSGTRSFYMHFVYNACGTYTSKTARGGFEESAYSIHPLREVNRENASNDVNASLLIKVSSDPSNTDLLFLA